MSLTRMHYNYMIVGKKHSDLTLLHDKVFPLIFKKTEPILEHTNIKKCRVSALQNGGSIKLGRLKWSLESLIPVCENYKNYEKFYFTTLYAEFPSIDVSYKNNESTEVYIQAENDSFWGNIKSEGDCGIFISIREDIYDKIGKEKAESVIKDLQSLFDEYKTIYHKRTWWYSHSIKEQFDNESEEQALQDVAPYRYTDKLTSKLYKNWKEIKL